MVIMKISVSKDSAGVHFAHRTFEGLGPDPELFDPIFTLTQGENESATDLVKRVRQEANQRGIGGIINLEE